MMHKKILFLCLLLSTSVSAETETSTSVWLMSLSRFQFDNNIRAFVDIQPRVTVEDIDNGDNGSIDTLLVRGAIGYQLRPNIGIYQGYALIPTYDPDRVEHRSFQELLATQKLHTGTLTHRVRFEQRLLENVDDLSLRVRYFGRYTYPLTSLHEKLSLAINEEVFIHVNDADTGPQSGFNQNRLFIGMNYHATSAFSFDLGYQNQYINGQAGRDNVMNHILFLGAISSF